MAQKSLRSKGKAKSAGALRKYVGEAKKKHTYTKRAHTPDARARASYTAAVEAAMASRVPSDQRSKLNIVKPAAAQSDARKHKKKPLTRGRKRKSAKH